MSFLGSSNSSSIPDGCVSAEISIPDGCVSTEIAETGWPPGRAARIQMATIRIPMYSSMNAFLRQIGVMDPDPSCPTDSEEEEEICSARARYAQDISSDAEDDEESDTKILEIDYGVDDDVPIPIALLPLHLLHETSATVTVVPCSICLEFCDRGTTLVQYAKMNVYCAACAASLKRPIG